MPDVIRGRQGRARQIESISGPGSYPSGGFSHRTDLGRVDEAMANSDSPDSVITAVTSIDSSNNLVIQAFGTDTGTEMGAGTDLTGVTITYTAQKL